MLIVRVNRVRAEKERFIAGYRDAEEERDSLEIMETGKLKHKEQRNTKRMERQTDRQTVQKSF